jgi:H+-transporting ATPase
MIAPHFVIFSTRTETFWFKQMPSLIFTAVVIITQVIALVLSVFGLFGEDTNIEPISVGLGFIILAISLGIFLLIDVIKVLTIKIWEAANFENKSMTLFRRKANNSKATRAQAFVQRQKTFNAGYNRAQRRESDGSIKSY